MRPATPGSDRVCALTRTDDCNTVLVAFDLGDAPAQVQYDGLARPGTYRDWFTNGRVPLAVSGVMDVPAHGCPVLVRQAPGPFVLSS